jgi:hypothetical protein
LIAGDVVFQYLPPFTFRRTADDQVDLTTTETSIFAYFVYEQANGRIDVTVEMDPCGPQLFNRLKVR